MILAPPALSPANLPEWRVAVPQSVPGQKTDASDVDAGSEPAVGLVAPDQGGRIEITVPRPVAEVPDGVREGVQPVETSL
ncbi:MAG: hypothetical protein ACRDY7_02055, partial [Acidimicrobiia bacterium]